MNKKQIAAVVVAGTLIGGLAGAGIGAKVADDTDKVEDLTVSLNGVNTTLGEAKVKIAELEALEPVVEYVNVTKEVNVTVEKIVEVDNGDLDFVLDRLEDKDILDDAEEVVEELRAEDAALELAFAEVEAEFAEELDDANLVEEDEAELVKIETDFDEVDVKKSDFDDDFYKFVIEAKVEDTDKEKSDRYLFTVTVEDGEATITKVVEK